MLRTVERDCTIHESHRNKHDNTWVTKPLPEMRIVEGSQFVDIAILKLRLSDKTGTDLPEITC